MTDITIFQRIFLFFNGFFFSHELIYLNGFKNKQNEFISTEQNLVYESLDQFSPKCEKVVVKFSESRVDTLPNPRATTGCFASSTEAILSFHSS